jgi:hypothetical protein
MRCASGGCPGGLEKRNHENMVTVTKIVSGGQTGADRAALDFALSRSIPHGGWIPKGRRAEDGPLPERYRLNETATADYPWRTERNVMDSDGTVIISCGPLAGGSAFTAEMARKHKRRWLHLDMAKLSAEEAGAQLHSWLAENRMHVLNVAGPRHSEDATIYDATVKVLEAALGSG